MNITGADITGTGSPCRYCGGDPRRCGHCRMCGALGTCIHSAMDPAKNKIKPTYAEEAVDKAIIFLDQDVKIGEVLPEDDKVLNLLNNRHFIVDEAHRLNGKITKSDLANMLDIILEKKLDLVQIKTFARLEMKGEAQKLASEIFEDLGVTEMVTLYQIETLSAICRAIIRWIMVHHPREKEAPGIEGAKTPLMAWRLKDAIVEAIKSFSLKTVEPGGVDNKRQANQFKTNLNETDLILWNDQIWLTAIRGCECFVGTPVTEDIIGMAKPMFWMFEKPLTLNSNEFFDLSQGKYECVGFVVMPTMEPHISVKFLEETEGISFKPDPTNENKGYLTIDHSHPAVRETLAGASQEARDIAEGRKEPDGITSFLRPGFFAVLVFMPLDGRIEPEARFLAPLYVDELIPSESALYSIIIAAMKFLTLKYVAMDSARISNRELKQDRQLFKKVRKGRVEIPPIKIINLRRPERKTKEEEEADPTPKDKRIYNCHWFVDPHWRNQFYPSLGIHKIVRIWTYVKGDLSKPLKVHKEKVYKAVR